MSLFQDLQPASFKDAPFLVTSVRSSGGRKDVQHLYPNSDRQVIEDLGQAQRVYNVEALITAGSDNTSATYIQRRDKLLAVLEEGGKGKLVHPLYGGLENIVARTYTLVEDLTDLGVARFSIVFEVTGELGIPTAATSTINKVEASASLASDAFIADIAGNFSVTSSFTGNFTAALDKLNSFIDAVNENTSLLQGEADSIDALSNELSDFSNNLTSLIQAPSELASGISTLFDTIEGLYPTAEATVEVFKGFFTFGDDDMAINETTAIRVERAKNARVINKSVQGFALVKAYVSTAKIDFGTVPEITASAETLDEQYQRLMINDGLEVATKDAITALRHEVQTLFDEQQLTSNQVITVDTPLTSARLLAYQYYGSSENGARLIDLNSARDVTFMEGSVEVLSA